MAHFNFTEQQWIKYCKELNEAYVIIILTFFHTRSMSVNFSLRMELNYLWRDFEAYNFLLQSSLTSSSGYKYHKQSPI